MSHEAKTAATPAKTEATTITKAQSFQGQPLQQRQEGKRPEHERKNVNVSDKYAHAILSKNLFFLVA